MRTNTKIFLAGLSAIFLAWLTAYGDHVPLGMQWASAQLLNVPDSTFFGIQQTASLVITMLNFIGMMILWFIEPLFSPFVIGEIGSEESRLLNQVWQFSRDIMNVIFAFILAAGAIVTVVTANKQFISDKIVKFVLAVILVNFSWFFPRVIFDIANVTTASIFQLPNLVSSAVGTTCQTTDLAGNIIPCQVMTHFEIFPNPPDKPCPGLGAPVAAFNKVALVCMANLNPATNTSYGIINGLVLNYGRLKDMPFVCAPLGGERFDEIFRTLMMTLLVAFFHVLLVFPLIAIVAMMIIRIPILWLTISFMPFAFLGMLVPTSKFDTKEMIFKKFISAAFLPAAIAIPFAVGFIMLNSLGNPTSTPPSWAGSLSTPSTPLICNINNMWLLLWTIVSFFVIWSGVFMASQIDSVYEKAAGTVKAIGEKSMKLPLNIPILPAGTKQGPDGKPVPRKLSARDVLSNPIGAIFNPASLDNIKNPGGGAGRTPQQAVQKAVTNNRQEFTNTFNNIIKEAGPGPGTQDLTDLRKLMADNQINDQAGLREVGKALNMQNADLDKLEQKLRNSNIPK